MIGLSIYLVDLSFQSARRDEYHKAILVHIVYNFRNFLQLIMVRLLSSASVFVFVANIAEGKSEIGIHLLALSLNKVRIDCLF